MAGTWSNVEIMVPFSEGKESYLKHMVSRITAGKRMRREKWRVKLQQQDDSDDIAKKGAEDETNPHRARELGGLHLPGTVEDLCLELHVS